MVPDAEEQCHLPRVLPGRCGPIGDWSTATGEYSGKMALFFRIRNHQGSPLRTSARIYGVWSMMFGALQADPAITRTDRRKDKRWCWVERRSPRQESEIARRSSERNP